MSSLTRRATRLWRNIKRASRASHHGSDRERIRRKEAGEAGARKKTAAEAHELLRRSSKGAAGRPINRIKSAKLRSGAKPAVFLAPQLATLVRSRLAGTIGFTRSSSTATGFYRFKPGDVKVFTRAANDWTDRSIALCGARQT